MSVQRIAALGVSVIVLTAGALAGGAAGAAGQAAARETAASTVSVSISAAHNVTLPATIQPGVNEFRVTTEAKGSGFQLLQLADDFAVLPIADAARASFASVDLDEDQAGDVRVGRALDLTLPGDGPHAVFAPGGQFLALYEQRGQQARPVAVFV